MIQVETDVAPDWPDGDWPALAARAGQAAVAASDHAGLANAADTIEVSVVFSDDETVRQLNLGWRNKDRPTNVLSFPMIDPDMLRGKRGGGGELLLGDIILAYGVCAREAADKGIPIEHHAAHLVVHGMLHLLGYDHETGEADAEAMEAVERAALARIGIADPYVLSEVDH